MKRTLATGLLVAGLVVLPVTAQSSSDSSMSHGSGQNSTMPRSGSGSETSADTYERGLSDRMDLNASRQTDTEMARRTEVDHDNDFDLGWMGLLGLAGLAGLRRSKKTHIDRTHNHTADTTYRTDTTYRDDDTRNL